MGAICQAGTGQCASGGDFTPLGDVVSRDLSAVLTAEEGPLAWRGPRVLSMPECTNITREKPGTVAHL